MSTVYRNDASGNLVFMWQYINDNAPTGLTVNVVNTWRFFAYPGGLLLGTGDLGAADGALYANLDANLPALSPFPYAVAGSVGPSSITLDVPSATLSGNFSPALGGGQHSFIWFAYTNALNYSFTVPGVDILATAEAFANEPTNHIALNFRTFEPSPVPEPASLFLMGSGLVGLAGAMRRKLAK